MARFGVVCASGMGDALILGIVSHYLRLVGHEVVTFSDHLGGFGAWLAGAKVERQVRDVRVLESFDAVILQHDNTQKAREILGLRGRKRVYCLYTNYRASKHGERGKYDVAFDENCSMVANVKIALKELFGIEAAGGENGLLAPGGAMYKKYPKRVVIHPTSGASSKNWPKEKFLKVAKWLKGEGYDPVFVTAPQERAEWNAAELNSLEDLASFLYESGAFLGNDSGPGHLASYLKIPYLIIGKQERQMKLWRPGWHPGTVVTAPSWIPNWKGWRLRDEKWKHFITSKKIIKLLQKKILQ